MAIVIAPALSEQASGNVGSINFTRWRGRAIARTTYTYTDPQTVKQVAQRGKLTVIAGKWGSVLNADQRLQWEERAADEMFVDRMGQRYRPSGYQLFMKFNLQVSVFGEMFLQVPPARLEPVFTWNLHAKESATKDANYILIAKASLVGVDADGQEIMKAGPYISGGRRPIIPEYRLLVLDKPIEIYYDYDVINGKYYWYKVRWYMNEGYTGNWWEKQVLTDFP